MGPKTALNRVRRLYLRQLLVLSWLALVSACAVNPVTGQREITLVGEATEIGMGEQNYTPMQQSQGGEYDIDPELTEYVQGVGNRLAAVSDRDLPYEFVVLNNSVPNAWALPGGKIAINRGLLTELESEAELAAVLGHEIVHAAARHSARQMERAMLMQGLVLATAVAASDSDYGNLAVGGANIAGQLLMLRYSRGAELEADRYGMEYMARAGYDPQGAVTLQEKFVRLSEGQRSDWLSGLFASHPPSQERVETNRATAAGLAAGGRDGREDYARYLARTREAAPAYEVYDEGRQALAERNTDLALARAEEAIGLLPDEAHFYALRGDARLLGEDYPAAVASYDDAIERRDDFFYYYLQRGVANERLGRDDLAVADLEKSLGYLPTGNAHFVLGNIATKRGERARAIEHYRVVAEGQGEVAEAARGALVRLDLPQNPGAYLQTRCDADRNGDLVVSIRNAAGVRVRNVSVAVQVRDASGVPRQLERTVRASLDPGEVVSIPTGLGPWTPGAGCPVRVTGAQLAD